MPIYEPHLNNISLSSTTELTCVRCGQKYLSDYQTCVKCKGPLLVEHDLARISRTVSKNTFKNRVWGVWRYLELLPQVTEERIVSLGEGGTALLKCERLARALGLQRVYVKDETTNPTGSFLDRGMTVDVSRASEIGFSSLRCRAVSGNFAASASSYASRAGLSCTIHLSRKIIERLDLGKLYQTIAYGANLVVEDEENPFHEQNSIGTGSYLLSPSNPYFAEGEKTTAYEICEQLGWRTPDRIVVPMGHGEHLSMIWRGIKELSTLGLVNEHGVAMTGVQVGDYAEIVDRLHGQAPEYSLDKAKTVAVDLAMKDPSHEYLAIRSIKESKGEGVKVKDTEILEAMRILARTEGIFAEPAAASTVAGLKKLIDQGRIDKDEEIVCVITGAGLKDPSTARRFVTRVREVDKIVSSIESRKFTTRLGGTKLEILRIISANETYGYAIWGMLRRKLKMKLDISSVYQHLSELEKMGLIRRTKVESVLGKPERYYYLLTHSGKSVAKTL